MSLDIQVKLWLGHQNIHIEILCTMWFQISNLMNVEWESDHGSSEGEEEESLWKANLSKQGPLFKAGQLLQHQLVELNENKLPPSWSFHCWLAEKQLTKHQKHFGHFVLNLDSCPTLNDRFTDCWTKIPLNCGSNFIQYFPHYRQTVKCETQKNVLKIQVGHGTCEGKKFWRQWWSGAWLLATAQWVDSKAVCTDWGEIFLFQDFIPWLFKGCGVEDKFHKTRPRMSPTYMYKDVSLYVTMRQYMFFFSKQLFHNLSKFPLNCYKSSRIATTSSMQLTQRMPQ